MRDDGSVKLPKQYQKTTFTLNGKDFTAWQDTDNAEYYVMYALNKDGQKGLYQYDTVDKTYQRYLKHSGTDDTADKASAKGLWGKILQFIEDFLDILVIVAIAAFLVLVVVLIVIGVKLHHRNLELDDLYDEYGIDLDEEEAVPAKGKGKKAKAVAAKGEPAVRKPVQKAKVQDEDDFDDFEEFEDDDFDDFGEEADLEEEYDEVDYEEDYGFDNDSDESEELIDDLDELLSSQPSKKRGHMEEDDTFKVDFIDLD